MCSRKILLDSQSKDIFSDVAILLMRKVTASHYLASAKGHTNPKGIILCGSSGRFSSIGIECIDGKSAAEAVTQRLIRSAQPKRCRQIILYLETATHAHGVCG